MVPLVKCMEDEEKEKLNQAFKKDFQNLNSLLSNNGFPTCEAFGKTSFDAFTSYPGDEEDKTNIDDSIHELSFKSSPTFNDAFSGDHFLPTKSPKRVVTRRNVINRQGNYKSFSKILI